MEEGSASCNVASFGERFITLRHSLGHVTRAYRMQFDSDDSNAVLSCIAEAVAWGLMSSESDDAAEASDMLANSDKFWRAASAAIVRARQGRIIPFPC